MMFGTNKGILETVDRIPMGTTGVEIGVWKGDGSAALLWRAGFLHLVDPWSVDAYAGPNEFGGFDAYLERYSALVGSPDPAAFQAYYDQVHASVVNRFAGAQVKVHRMTSRQFFREFDDLVDWFYIDGSHHELDVFQDIEAAKMLVQDCIMGDDYGVKPGVTAAVDRASENGLRLEIFPHGQWRIR